MSVDNAKVVDFLCVDNVTGDVVLTITDHLPWSECENEHLFLLQEKLNAYLRFIESGELLDTYPNAKSRPVLIDVAYKYPLSQHAQDFIDLVVPIVEGAGIKIRFELFQESEE
jgi:hypothetical protein